MSGLTAADIQPRAQSALNDSPIFALRELRVEQTEDGLLISGSVNSFYHKQLAQEAVRAVLGTLGDGIALVNTVQVRNHE